MTADEIEARIRSGEATEQLDNAISDYCAGFKDACVGVVEFLRGLGHMPTVREFKTPASIRAKLLRDANLRLKAMYDIAGCRVVVSDRRAQADLIRQIRKRWGTAAAAKPRLDRSEHSYQAVHVVLRLKGGKRIEVQVRTEHQERWAQFSERVDSQYHPGAKHGQAPSEVLEHLAEASKKVSFIEREQEEWQALEGRIGLSEEEDRNLSHRYDWRLPIEEGLLLDLTDNIVHKPIDWSK